MGNRSVYKCLSCKNEFEARGGGGFFFLEYRCVDCDATKAIHLKSKHERKVTAKEIGRCEKCGGQLRDDIKPMCPKCKSREVEVSRTIMYYD